MPLVADWSPTVAFFASAALLQLAFATVLFVKAKRDETTWVIGLIFGVNGMLAAFRAINWMFLDSPRISAAVTNTTWPFDVFTNILIGYLALIYPRKVKWMVKHPLLGRGIAAALALVFAVPAFIEPLLQPHLAKELGWWGRQHASFFFIIANGAFPLLLIRWAYLLPTIQNPAQLRQFRLLFAAFGVRATHMIGTWGTLQVAQALEPGFWKEFSGPLLGLGLVPTITGLAMLASLVMAMTHLLVQRTRSPTDNQRAIGFVLLFLAFGILEAALDTLTLRPIAGEYLALVIHPLTQVDVLIIRPILVWAAMVRHQFMGGVVRGPAALQGIAFAVATPAFYGGYLPLVTANGPTSTFATATAAFIAVAAGALVALGVRPLALASTAGTPGFSDTQAESDYLAAVEDVYRRGAQGSAEETTLQALRLGMGISKERAQQLEAIVRDFWNRRQEFGDWRIGDRVLGRYTIDEILGQGGMSHAYRCHDELANRPVVLKRQLNLDEASLAAIHQEGRTLAQLQSPYIVQLVRTESLANESILVLEFMAGGSLEDRLLEGPLDEKEVLSHARNLLEALFVAHSFGVVHRDVKPSNILFDSAGKCKLADFGIAHQHRPRDTLVVITQGATRLMGSIRYMAPEQLELGETSVRSDLFSLGAVLLDCLRGPSVENARTRSDMRVHAGQRGPVFDLSGLPKSLKPLLENLLQHQPKDRVASAKDALKLLP